MKIREEMNMAKKELNDLKEQSWAMEILHDYKKANKRLFISLIIILSMWFATIGYLVYILNDIGTYDSIEIEDVENIDNSHIKIGDDIWEKSE
jgi:hypothetical protein